MRSGTYGKNTSVEGASACSACAGDYEDPERSSAATEQEDTDEDERDRSGSDQSEGRRR